MPSLTTQKQPFASSHVANAANCVVANYIALQGGGREVKGLMEALQVTAPRASSSGHMPGLASNSASGYPSVHAMADLTAADASQGIWAAAILGGSAMYEPETDGLIQVTY